MMSIKMVRSRIFGLQKNQYRVREALHKAVVHIYDLGGVDAIGGLERCGTAELRGIPLFVGVGARF